MDLRNQLQLFVSRRRWLKKALPPNLIDTAYVTLGEGRRIYADARDLRGPSFHVLYGGAQGFDQYELTEKEAILRYLPEDGVFLDIGANIGLFSLYAHWARPHAEIHSFEAHPRNAECLRRSCESNGISGISTHAFAIGDGNGELELFFDESDAGGHSAFRETLVNNHERTQSIRVPMTSIDDFAQKRKLRRLDVIKMDIQGCEAAAIRGAREVLQRFEPALLIECDHRQILENSGKDSPIQALENTGVGYKALAIGGRPDWLNLSQLKEEARKEIASGMIHRNYLFAKG